VNPPSGEDDSDLPIAWDWPNSVTEFVTAATSGSFGRENPAGAACPISSVAGEDVRTLALPDTLFWAYKPLRPVLWLWRWTKQLMQRTPHLTN
jgi:hypothetical protein